MQRHVGFKANVVHFSVTYKIFVLILNFTVQFISSFCLSDKF